MSGVRAVRAAEAVIEVATDPEFSQSRVLGRVQNVAVSRNPRATEVPSIGSYFPDEIVPDGESSATVSFNFTPEKTTKLYELGLMPRPGDELAFSPFHMRIRTDSGTLAKLFECAPTAEGTNLAALDHATGSYNAIAKRAGTYDLG
ncbi:MAG: hypothetical protein WC551_10025 [Patescibacteria group bacterium]|jgi:hypothetical protein